MSKSKAQKSKKVSFSGKYIRNITRRNRRTGTQDNVDSDSDLVEDYTETFSPLPSPLPSPVSDIPIVPIASRPRHIFYRPIISVFNKINGKIEYSEEYTLAFIQFLEGKEIVCNNDTEILLLAEELNEMLKEDYRKNIQNIQISRGQTIFNINSNLGTYSEQIQDYSEQNGMNNYFSIAVLLDDIIDGGSRRKKTTRRRKTIRRKKTIRRI